MVNHIQVQKLVCEYLASRHAPGALSPEHAAGLLITQFGVSDSILRIENIGAQRGNKYYTEVLKILKTAV
jgi:hypothetical protein